MKLNTLANGGEISVSQIAKRSEVRLDGLPIFLGRGEHKQLPVDTANRIIEIKTKGNLDYKKTQTWIEAEELLRNRDAVKSYFISVIQQTIVLLETDYKPEEYFTRMHGFEKLFWACSKVLSKAIVLTEFFQQAVKNQTHSGSTSYPEVEIIAALFDDLVTGETTLLTDPFVKIEDIEKHDTKNRDNVIKKSEELIDAEFSSVEKRKLIKAMLSDIVWLQNSIQGLCHVHQRLCCCDKFLQ